MLFGRKERAPILSKKRLVDEFANKGLRNVKLCFFSSTDSTNTRARIFAEKQKENTKCNAVFIARKQSSGRGRRGRRFESGKETGLWLSFLIYPKAPEDAAKLTVYAATRVVRTLKALLGEATATPEPMVKWVNDIYMNDKKLCGILAEGNLDRGYAICGIGINLYKTEFPPELCNIATDLESEAGITADRAKLAALLAEEFFGGLDELGNSDVIEEYKRCSFILGEKITVINQAESYPSTAVDINEKGELIAEKENGERVTLNSGEVSIRRLANSNLKG